MGGYLSEQGIANLAIYSYNGVDRSIIANSLLKHYWNFLIEHVVPLWLAPNLLTLFGWLCVMGSFLLLVIFCPDGVDGLIPRGVYFIIAILIFAYQTLDNLDGKQARRTGSSSPLGELFDHGADSMSVPVFSIIYGTMLHLGPSITFLVFLMMATVFYLAHWESYFTRTLILRPLANPTEAQLTLILLLLITYLYGPQFWLGVVVIPLWGPIQLKNVIFLLSMMGFILTCSDNMKTVFYHVLSRHQPLKNPFLYFLPFSILVFFSSLWILLTPEVLLEYPRTFLCSIGLLFSYLTIRSIVQSIAKEAFKLYYNALTPLVLASMHSLLGILYSPLFDYEIILYCFFICTLLIQANLVVSLIFEFCYYLNIHPFRINVNLLPSMKTTPEM